PSVPRTASEIGTDAALMKLRDKLAGQGGLYLSADLVNVYQTGRGITQYDGVLQSVANTVQRQYALRLDNAAVDSRYQSWFLLRPSIFEDVFGDYADDFTKAGYTLLSADNLGSMLYSELGSKGTGRNEALRIMERTAALLEEKTEGLMLEGGNDYAAVHAAHVVGTPARDSGYDLEDVSVPFWQMVFHGYVNYSLGAMNLSSNPSEQVLRSLEYGASPFFSLVLENPDELIGSRLDRLYSARAEDWTDYMGKAYRQINTALREASASVIVSHEIVSSQVRKVLYDNGLTVYVNYGVEKASADGLEIPAEGFTVVKNGSLVLSEAAAREE
ncbi:MAG: hypothetical protein J6Y95_00220, partial [Lachnospiraceae bacterium]|nr:hypothetical protein [Lachnospiraceae bacterium]